MRPSSQLTRSACAAVLTLVMLLAACVSPTADADNVDSVGIWSETVNERAGYMRQTVSELPWAERSEQLRQHAEAENDDADDSTGEPRPAPGPEPIFVKNPAGPVDCSEVSCVALTFDDGPSAHTREVLAALAEVEARASFFMTGEMASSHPGIAAEVAAGGHELGNHGWSHKDFTELSHDQLRAELTNTAQAIEAATGITPTMARPPYGSMNSEVSDAAGLPMIMWSVDSLDWRHRSSDLTHRQVLDEVEPGAIVLMHDLEESTAEVLPVIVRDLLAKGYHLVTVSEVLGHPGDPGQAYHAGLRP